MSTCSPCLTLPVFLLSHPDWGQLPECMAPLRSQMAGAQSGKRQKGREGGLVCSPLPLLVQVLLELNPKHHC